jgi:NAD(P)-dependent dehydrogenase (short-subunit alcohol dehydrogenase family)
MSDSSAKLFDMTGKVAIVTGASRGIGEVIARTLAAAGAKVTVVSRKIEGVTAVAESIGDAAHPVAAHTGKEDDCRNAVQETIRKFGQVDVLVNNAATNPYFGPMLGIDMGAWDKTFEVNLKGYFWMTREVANHLVSRSAPGSIVNVASVNGVEAAPLQGVYGATKAAVISMTKTLAFELGPSRIRVNAICPGLIETKFAATLVQNEDLLRRITDKTPLGRHGQPGEIAGGALYLASDAASFLTGHALVIDGGMTIC